MASSYSHLVLLTCLVLSPILLTFGQDSHVTEDVNDRPVRQSSLNGHYGQKLSRKKLGRKLEEDVSEYYDAISSTISPQKTKHGRVPSKVMVRTYKTTTSTTTPRYDEAETTLPVWSAYYQNPYVSRKPSVPPKKYVDRVVATTGRVTTRTIRTTTITPPTTTPLPYTFPPYVSEDNGHPDESREVQHVYESIMVNEPATLSRTLQTPRPERKVTLSSRGKVHNVKSSHQSRRPVQSTTTEPQTTPDITTTQTPTYYPGDINLVENSETTFTPEEEPTTTTTTTTTTTREQETTPTPLIHDPPPPPRELTSPPRRGVPLRVFTQTFKPVYRIIDEDRKPEDITTTSGSSEESTTLPPDTDPTTTLTSPTTPAPQRITAIGNKNKVHYIITVIDPPKSNITSGLGEKVEEFVESSDDGVFPFSNLLTTPSPSLATSDSLNSDQEEKDDNDHLEVIKRIQQSLNLNNGLSPQNKFVPAESAGAREEQIFHFSSNQPYQPEPYHHFPSNFISPDDAKPRRPHLTSSNNFIVEDSKPFRRPVSTSNNDFSPQLIPLRTVVTYQPVDSASLNSDPFSTKSVAYYTHVSPDGKITKQLVKNPYQQENSFEFLTREQRSSRGQSQEISAVPAQSYYLDQQVRPGARREQYDEGNLRTVPFRVELVPIQGQRDN